MAPHQLHGDVSITAPGCGEIARNMFTVSYMIVLYCTIDTVQGLLYFNLQRNDFTLLYTVYCTGMIVLYRGVYTVQGLLYFNIHRNDFTLLYTVYCTRMTVLPCTL